MTMPFRGADWLRALGILRGEDPSELDRHEREGGCRDDVAVDRAGRAVGKRALRAWIARRHAFRRGPGQAEFDCRPRPAPLRNDVCESEGGRQIAEPDAAATPPRVRSSPEKLQLRSVLADQHLPDGGRELGADPGVRHIADIIRYAGVAPDALAPAAPAGGPAPTEHGRKKREGVAVSAERHEGAQVANDVGR